MKLSDLKKNDLAYISKININSPLGLRLKEMGFVPNTKIKILFYTKSKDMILIFLRNYSLVLSKSIADKIMVIK